MGIEVHSIDQLVDSIDMNYDGWVDFSEFVACLLHTQETAVEDVIGHAFKAFDQDADSQISLEELRSMLTGDGPLVSVLPDGMTVEQVLVEVDTSKDGLICLR